jgi:hypothetical protein
LGYLPFRAEPICEWNEDCDLQQFLCDLFDAPSVVYAPDGSKHEGNYRDYGRDLFHQEVPVVTSLAADLTKVSSHDYHQDHARIRGQTHDFMGDPLFGLAAKGVMACKGILSAILSESGFMSLHHILESDSDLDCSLHLLKTHHYKQSGYCLRAFLENSVLPVYFAAHPSDYKSWKQGSLHLPPLRGPKGLLEVMRGEGLIDASIKEAVSGVYGALNAFVHSSAPAMIHTGHETGNWRGLSFKLDAIHGWCELVAKACDARIRLAERENDHWHQFRSKAPTMCDTCHEKEFIRAAEKASHHQLWKYQCRKCGSVSFRDA